MWLQKDITPILGRVIFCVVGAGFAVGAYEAFRYGAIQHNTDAEPAGIVTRSGEPALFWTLTVIFCLVSLIMFYLAVKGKRDA